MTSPADADLANQVLDLIRAASPTAEAEVMVDRLDLALTRFANSFIHQNVSDSTALVRLRLHDSGRTAMGSSTRAGADGLRDLVERTVAAARHSPVDPQWPGLAGPAPVAGSVPVDPGTAYAEPGTRAERVRAFVDATGGLSAAGYCRTTRFVRTFANSLGQSAQGETAQAGLDGVVRAGAADGKTSLAAARLDQLDGAVLGARAAAKARAGQDPVELPPGRYQVVLEPTAAYSLVFTVGAYGFNGKSVNERQSFVEVGRAQFDPTVTIVDDPRDPIGGMAFDIEGTPKVPLTFVESGVSRHVAHDRRSAAVAGTRSTGHALPGGASFGAIPVNLHLAPDTARAELRGESDGPAADLDVAALVSQVNRGLLVTDIWYTNVLDPRSLVVTGLTRNGVWLIEQGEVVGPVQNFRFTQSYPDALAAGAVLGVGTHAVALADEWELLTYRVPALRLASWNCTGNASG
jgi:predicted Zn-dependent protease